MIDTHLVNQYVYPDKLMAKISKLLGKSRTEGLVENAKLSFMLGPVSCSLRTMIHRNLKEAVDLERVYLLVEISSVLRELAAPFTPSDLDYFIVDALIEERACDKSRALSDILAEILFNAQLTKG